MIPIYSITKSMQKYINILHKDQTFVCFTFISHQDGGQDDRLINNDNVNTACIWTYPQYQWKNGKQYTGKQKRVWSLIQSSTLAVNSSSSLHLPPNLTRVCTTGSSHCKFSGQWPALFSHGLNQTLHRLCTRELAGKNQFNVSNSICVLTYSFPG